MLDALSASMAQFDVHSVAEDSSYDITEVHDVSAPVFFVLFFLLLLCNLVRTVALEHRKTKSAYNRKFMF